MLLGLFFASVVVLLLLLLLLCWCSVVVVVVIFVFLGRHREFVEESFPKLMILMADVRPVPRAGYIQRFCWRCHIADRKRAIRSFGTPPSRTPHAKLCDVRGVC